jgi:cyclopropane fatty-acyl-phospholipid synthase-like methyltransferase
MSHRFQYARALALWGALLLFRRRESVFTLGGKTYEYFTHPYNLTWLHERSVEIPLMQSVLASHPLAKTLEVGHVLAHYNKSLRHDVVDKYEAATYPALYREDAVDFLGNAPYDLIVSVSTLEHVGWDETPRDPEKVVRTIEHLRGLLTDNGRLFFTVPVGYNPGLDAFLDRGEEFVRRDCLKRVSSRNEWREVNWEEIRGARFHQPYPFANGLVFAELAPLR